MLNGLRRRAAALISPPAPVVESSIEMRAEPDAEGRVILRDLSPLTPGRGEGGFPYSSVASYYSRYTQQWQEILAAQELYESESYASAIIKAIIKFAIGRGVEFDWGDPYSQAMWDEWQWSTYAPHARYGERQRLGLTQIIRDGDLFHKKEESGSGLRLFPYDPAMFRSYGQGAEGEKQQNGVVVRADLTPVAYMYQPTAVPYQSLAAREPERIPAGDMIHVWNMEEYDLQARGRSWLRRALVPLEALAKYDAMMLAAGEISVSSPGYWSIPMQYFSTYAVQDTDNPVSAVEAAVIKRIFESRTLDDIRAVQKLVEGFEWRPQPTSGIGEGTGISAIHAMLGTRSCLAVGLSPFAVYFHLDRNVGFMSARQITESDKRFYELAQELICRYETTVADWWSDWMAANDPRFAERYRGFYEIWCAPQPYLDPAKDAAYWEKGIRGGWASPQEAMRANGKNPQRVMAEIEEWARFAARIRAETGIDIVGHKDVAADLIEALNGAEDDDGEPG